MILHYLEPLGAFMPNIGKVHLERGRLLLHIVAFVNSLLATAYAHMIAFAYYCLAVLEQYPTLTKGANQHKILDAIEKTVLDAKALLAFATERLASHPHIFIPLGVVIYGTITLYDLYECEPVVEDFFVRNIAWYDLYNSQFAQHREDVRRFEAGEWPTLSAGDQNELGALPSLVSSLSTGGATASSNEPTPPSSDLDTPSPTARQFLYHPAHDPTPAASNITPAPAALPAAAPTPGSAIVVAPPLAPTPTPTPTPEQPATVTANTTAPRSLGPVARAHTAQLNHARTVIHHPSAVASTPSPTLASPRYKNPHLRIRIPAPDAAGGTGSQHNGGSALASGTTCPPWDQLDVRMERTIRSRGYPRHLAARAVSQTPAFTCDKSATSVIAQSTASITFQHEATLTGDAINSGFNAPNAPNKAKFYYPGNTDDTSPSAGHYNQTHAAIERTAKYTNLPALLDAPCDHRGANLAPYDAIGNAIVRSAAAPAPGLAHVTCAHCARPACATWDKHSIVCEWANRGVALDFQTSCTQQEWMYRTAALRGILDNGETVVAY